MSYLASRILHQWRRPESVHQQSLQVYMDIDHPLGQAMSSLSSRPTSDAVITALALRNVVHLRDPKLFSKRCVSSSRRGISGGIYRVDPPSTTINPKERTSTHDRRAVPCCRGRSAILLAALGQSAWRIHCVSNSSDNNHRTFIPQQQHGHPPAPSLTMSVLTQSLVSRLRSIGKSFTSTKA